LSAERLVVGISGSSGVILGIRLLQALQGGPIETHLVITPAARVTIEQETNWKLEDVLALATTHYSPRDIGAAIASGSFATRGMVVIPCSIKSLSSIANSYAAELLTRAADVTLKEGRPLLLVVRETPLHRGHIRLMDQAAAAGAVIFPPVPAFYTHPQRVDELVDNLVGRVLARLGIENDLYRRWQGTRPAPADGEEAWPPADLLALPAMTLATGSPEGDPHAAPVYFAADEKSCLYFFSDADSQHALDLQGDARAAAAIHPLVSGWQEIRGLQLRGRVRAVPAGAEWERAWVLYQAKFPFVAQLKQVVARSTLYVFEPDWVRLVDNRKGLGYKEEREMG
jgi:4-hydroxy-3-polyprenylbenzoate decarboxylase